MICTDACMRYRTSMMECLLWLFWRKWPCYKGLRLRHVRGKPSPRRVHDCSTRLSIIGKSLAYGAGQSVLAAPVAARVVVERSWHLVDALGEGSWEPRAGRALRSMLVSRHGYLEPKGILGTRVGRPRCRQHGRSMAGALWPLRRAVRGRHGLR